MVPTQVNNGFDPGRCSSGSCFFLGLSEIIIGMPKVAIYSFFPGDLGGHSSTGRTCILVCEEFRCLISLREAWRGAAWLSQLAGVDVGLAVGLLTDIPSTWDDLQLGWPWFSLESAGVKRQTSITNVLPLSETSSDGEPSLSPFLVGRCQTLSSFIPQGWSWFAYWTIECVHTSFRVQLDVAVAPRQFPHIHRHSSHCSIPGQSVCSHDKCFVNAWTALLWVRRRCPRHSSFSFEARFARQVVSLPTAGASKVTPTKKRFYGSRSWSSGTKFPTT